MTAVLALLLHATPSAPFIGHATRCVGVPAVERQHSPVLHAGAREDRAAVRSGVADRFVTIAEPK